MQNYVYAPILYPGTRELLAAFNAKRLVRHDGMRFMHNGRPVKFTSTDVVICWGHHVPPVEGVTVINSNYTFVNQFQLNVTRENQFRGNLAIISLEKMAGLTYKTELETLRANNNKSKNAPVAGILPYEEFEGYGKRYFNYITQTRIAMFGEKVLWSDEYKPSDIEAAKLILTIYGLDFGVVTVGNIEGTMVIRKLLTAPALDTTKAKLIVDVVNLRVKEKQNVDMVISEVSNI